MKRWLPQSLWLRCFSPLVFAVAVLACSDSDAGSGEHDASPIEVDAFVTPEGLIFFDDFEYVAGRDDPAVVGIFQSEGGWSGVKTIQDPNSGSPKGHIYTTDNIPGYSGSFPGGDSNHVLALEALPFSLDGQTDFYLQYGSSNGPTDAIPSNVWFQFWVYPNYYDDPADQEDQLSGFGHHFKFIYPCAGSYPCQTGSWLLLLGARSDHPHDDLLGEPSQDLYAGLTNAGASFPGDGNAKIGQTDITELLRRNRWTLVKLHIDTSTSAGRFETWLKPMGGDWIKTADWSSGVEGLDWTVPNVGRGHSVFRMPTTLGRANNTELYDSWIYMDDFAMAHREGDLPVY